MAPRLFGVRLQLWGFAPVWQAAIAPSAGISAWAGCDAREYGTASVLPSLGPEHGDGLDVTAILMLRLYTLNEPLHQAEHTAKAGIGAKPIGAGDVGERPLSGRERPIPVDASAVPYAPITVIQKSRPRLPGARSALNDDTTNDRTLCAEGTKRGEHTPVGGRSHCSVTLH